jgi:hypothetical protein
MCGTEPTGSAAVAVGALVCGALLRRLPLTRPADIPAREPSRPVAAARS